MEKSAEMEASPKTSHVLMGQIPSRQLPLGHGQQLC